MFWLPETKHTPCIYERRLATSCASIVLISRFAEERDFSQVISKLDQKAYSDVHGLESDLNLIFSNAKV